MIAGMNAWQFRIASWPAALRGLAHSLWHFPWRNTAHTLRERFREDRLGLTAGSLTFTTTIALVPFFTVLLAAFTAFPVFAKFQGQLQQWLVQSLVPEAIARQVLGYLTQFAGKASRLGGVGAAVLLLTALALLLTIDRTLNGIWRVRQLRPLGQRVLVYWAAVTLGPLLLGLSLAGMSYAVSASRGWNLGPLDGLSGVLDAAQFLLLGAAMAALYHAVPNTPVRWAHAWVGGLFVAGAFELAKALLVGYLKQVPTYSAVYGAFATLPILLIWIYTAWVIVLLGAVITAYLPSLLSGVPRRSQPHGWSFTLALEVLQQLQAARTAGAGGCSRTELAQALRVDALQLEPALQALRALDWAAPLQPRADAAAARWVLLIDPDQTLLAPLAQRLLLAPDPSTEAVWQKSRLGTLMLREVL
ncbi:MAG: YihY family inner membrane protein [Rhodoferax sp.]